MDQGFGLLLHLWEMASIEFSAPTCHLGPSLVMAVICRVNQCMGALATYLSVYF